MQIKTTKADIIWNYLGTAFSMGSNFLLLPMLVFFLSEDELGLWYIYLAIGSLVVLFEFGFSPTFARNVAYCWSGAKVLEKEGRSTPSQGHKIDSAFFAALLAVCKETYARVTILAAAMLVFIATPYVLYISLQCPLETVVISWIVFACAALINLYYLYFSALLRGIGKVSSDNKIKIISRVIQLATCLILLVCGFGLIGASIAYLLYILAFRVLTHRSFWHDKTIQDLRISQFKPTRDEKKNIREKVSYNARKDGVVQVSNYISTQMSTILCSLFLGLAEAGAFSIALQFATAIGTLALSYGASYRPMMQSAFQRDDVTIVKTIIGKGCIAYVFTYVLGTLVTACILYPLLSLLSSNGDTFNILVYIGVAIYMFIFDWHSFFSSVLSNFNRIDYMLAYLLTSIASVLLCLLLLGPLHLGVWGLIVGLLIPQCVYNLWKWPKAATRYADTTVSASLKLGLKSFSSPWSKAKA